MDEPVWIARAQGGDQAAFRRLVEVHRERAYALALRITGTPADAEEVAQDAFVRVWRSLPAFRGESSFGTWLYRIVARQALDRRRSLVRREKVESPADSAAALEDVAAPQAFAGAGPASRRLHRLLGMLSDAQRAVVTLYYYEDSPVAEIARALDLPEGTVKTHLARARTALREAWEREERTGALPGAEEQWT
jgi:RNA polymerase sigma-70 factor (ECF subfamily)